MKNSNDEGFTLIELLIVIVILGILATVVVFSVRGITDQGQENACAADAKTLEVALEAYYAKYGNAVPSQTQLATAELIRDASTNYRVNVTSGDPTAISTGDCT